MRSQQWGEFAAAAVAVGAIVAMCVGMFSCFSSMDKWQAEHGHDYCDRALATAHTSQDSAVMYSGHWSYCIP